MTITWFAHLMEGPKSKGLAAFFLFLSSPLGGGKKERKKKKGFHIIFRRFDSTHLFIPSLVDRTPPLRPSAREA